MSGPEVIQNRPLLLVVMTWARIHWPETVSTRRRCASAGTASPNTINSRAHHERTARPSCLPASVYAVDVVNTGSRGVNGLLKHQIVTRSDQKLKREDLQLRVTEHIVQGISEEQTRADEKAGTDSEFGPGKCDSVDGKARSVRAVLLG